MHNSGLADVPEQGGVAMPPPEPLPPEITVGLGERRGVPLPPAQRTVTGLSPGRREELGPRKTPPQSHAS